MKWVVRPPARPPTRNSKTAGTARQPAHHITARHGTARPPARNGTARHGTASDTAWHDRRHCRRHGTTASTGRWQSGTARHGATACTNTALHVCQHGTARHSTAQRGMVRPPTRHGTTDGTPRHSTAAGGGARHGTASDTARHDSEHSAARPPARHVPCLARNAQRIRPGARSRPAGPEFKLCSAQSI